MVGWDGYYSPLTAITEVTAGIMVLANKYRERGTSDFYDLDRLQ